MEPDKYQKYREYMESGNRYQRRKKKQLAKQFNKQARQGQGKAKFHHLGR